LNQTIRIIRPSSREKDSLVTKKIASLENEGFRVLYDDIPKTSGPEWTSNSIEVRAKELNDALLEEDNDYILCARGGYGASDLLPFIDWKNLKGRKEKTLIGFSDICSLQSSLYSILGWKSIHGPMPATSYWNMDNRRDDIELLFDCINGQRDHFELPLDRNISQPGIASGGDGKSEISGWIFGGCFSVLTNLIGTRYFPASLKDAILVIEDVSENPARLMRFLNQWKQAGLLDGVKALVIGKLLDPDDEDIGLKDSLEFEFSSRTQLPTFTTKTFGHLCPNYPIKIGASAKISDKKLTWYP